MPISFSMVQAAVKFENHVKKNEAAIMGGVKTALEFHAIDIHGQANKSMGYKVSRSRGVATGGGETLMLPGKGRKIRGRVRHDEFGLQMFSYRWQPGGDELRVGPLRHGTTAGDSGPLQVHEGSRGGRTVYRDRYVFSRKKNGQWKKRPDKDKQARFYGHTKGYALQRGGYSKPGFVIASRKGEKRVQRFKTRYEKLGKTGSTSGRAYLVEATKKRNKYLDSKIQREVARALKHGPRRRSTPPR